MMKKNSLKIALLAVVAAVAGYSAYQSQAQDNELSEIALANVEALASGEEGDDCHYINGYSAFSELSGGGYDCCNVWVNKAPRPAAPDCR